MLQTESANTPSRLRFQQLYREIRQRICLLGYPPGTKLREEELASEFGVSRSPIRRVLARLEADGLVETRHGVGSIVVDLDGQRLKYIYDLRLGLLTLFADMARPEVPEEILERMENLDAELIANKTVMTAEHLSRLNMQVSDLILDLVENTEYRNTIERLYYQTSRFFMLSIVDERLPEEIDVFHREVQDMLLALRAGDLAAFGSLRRTHVLQSYLRMSLADNSESRSGIEIRA